MTPADQPLSSRDPYRWQHGVEIFRLSLLTFRITKCFELPPVTGNKSVTFHSSFHFFKEPSQLQPLGRTCHKPPLVPKTSSLLFTPDSSLKVRLVGLGRLELPTPRLSSVCSNQLSYRPNKQKPKIYLRAAIPPPGQCCEPG